MNDERRPGEERRKGMDDMLLKVGEMHANIMSLKTEDIPELKAQTTKTNGRVTRLERALLIVAAVVLTLLVTSKGELIGFIVSLL